MTSLLRRIPALVATVMTSLCLATGALAQSPSKPVNLMVPYPAGGLSDVIARIVNQPLGKALGQQVIVENLGGVSGALGAQKVLAAPSDGQYLFQGSPNELILAPLANAAVKFKSEDFRLVQMIGVSPIAILARPGLPAKNVDELVALARKAAAEGKPLSYASVGVGSFYHVLGEHFSQTIGAKMTHIPYKGIAPIFQDLGGEMVDISIIVSGAQVGGLVDSGRLKIIGTLAPAGKVEAPFLKQYPSINDSKSVKDFAFNIWTGYFVKKDTPEPVVQALHKALSSVLTDPAVHTQLEQQAVMAAKPLSLADAQAEYVAQTARFRAIAKAIKLEAQ
ncbi:tripartite tricarboxylate transporter substrate binding protein [Ideonella sp. 4Y11]|uniref:Tripartite tricarboxylate transporter substrate binding protein n=1 Tax=Ideonella aquatica TaxID=2824119 RepID=A0A940YG07_9BURK|nr:tripartite tricarboxylate transporter substrate binding protein [Ideonella aquatica]MBQ0958052.1 tripartite tricarboxylate transporter substrate binding protein [Ideonella aquatica]